MKGSSLGSFCTLGEARLLHSQPPIKVGNAGNGGTHVLRIYRHEYSLCIRRTGHHPRQHRHRSRLEVQRIESTRTPKDPKAYASIEDLRRELEQAKGQAPFAITETIKWLGNAVNNGGATLAFQAYRYVLGLDQPLTWGGRRQSSSIDSEELRETELRTNPDLLDAMQYLLLVPRSAAVKLVYRCPAAAELSSTDLMKRLIDLKRLFPGSNVARMVELLPTAFLSGSWDDTFTHLRCTSNLLREGLEGADVDCMFENDPCILFEDPLSLKIGLERMIELWKVDATALKNSDPEELALAVRALSLKGPPGGV